MDHASLVVDTVLVLVSITDTVPSPLLTTYIYKPSGEAATP